MNPLPLLPWLWLAALATAPLHAAATELNLANQAELEQLQRVGPQLAQRILDDRARLGRYADWPDFQRRLKGVGPATAHRLSEAGLRINGQALPAPATASTASNGSNGAPGSPESSAAPAPTVSPPAPQPASAAS